MVTRLQLVIEEMFRRADAFGSARYAFGNVHTELIHNTETAGYKLVIRKKHGIVSRYAARQLSNAFFSKPGLKVVSRQRISKIWVVTAQPMTGDINNGDS